MNEPTFRLMFLCKGAFKDYFRFLEKAAKKN